MGDDLSGSWRYALKTLTAPYWLARVRMLSTMVYPEELVDGAQFSIWDSAWERVMRWERADRSPRRCLRAHMEAWWTTRSRWVVLWMKGESTTSAVDGPCDSPQAVDLYSDIVWHGRPQARRQPHNGASPVKFPFISKVGASEQSPRASTGPSRGTRFPTNAERLRDKASLHRCIRVYE